MQGPTLFVYLFEAFLMGVFPKTDFGLSITSQQIQAAISSIQYGCLCRSVSLFQFLKAFLQALSACTWKGFPAFEVSFHSAALGEPNFPSTQHKDLRKFCAYCSTGSAIHIQADNGSVSSFGLVSSCL